MPRRAQRDPVTGRKLPHPRKIPIRAQTANEAVAEIYEPMRREAQSRRARRLPAAPDDVTASIAAEFVRQHGR